MSGVESRLNAIWYGSRTPPLPLRAVSALYALCLRLRRPINTQELPVPVLVVGNFTVGGTGKTPLIIALAEHLRNIGYAPGVISRGYGRRDARPRRVDAHGDAEQVGDEPLLIAKRLGIPVRVDRDRLAAAQCLIAEGCDVVISDDGLQHRALPRMLEIEVVDARRGYGNGRLLPAGPLREPVRGVDLRVCHGADADDAGAYAMNLSLGDCRRLSDGESRPLAWFQGQHVHALAGIGHPARFFDALRAQGLKPETHAFPDHHRFQPKDLPEGIVLMTEKDAVKCARFAHPGLWAVPAQAHLSPRFFTRLAELMARPRSPT